MNVLPVDLTALVGTILGTLIVLIPVAGLTARFALKPIAEAMARARESQSSAQSEKMLEQRMALLEQQMAMLETDIRQLEEAESFRKQLTSSPPR